MELNIGCLLTLQDNGATQYNFQNYTVRKSVVYGGATYTFAPFAFSGAISNIQGDNLDAGLQFQATKVTRTWAETAIVNNWVGTVTVVLLKDDSSIERVLYSYAGVVAAGGWQESTIELSLNSVMDAVRGTIPGRRMTHQLVGMIPVSANINV
ncbi:MAG: hypothetical protein CMA72_06065 [Euryarchaeota archaeon]|nr:hypothetical protein [Euryarchaeota archaeon]|tara:strand:+ start:1100 stop:1558 length:459 start_codon:yes stop_codon:yes gene_type:complete